MYVCGVMMCVVSVVCSHMLVFGVCYGVYVCGVMMCVVLVVCMVVCVSLGCLFVVL